MEGLVPIYEQDFLFTNYSEVKSSRLILSNLKRKKLRTVLTALSIMVAFLLFGFLNAGLRFNRWLCSA